ncbi:putative dolichyl-diphosphooligosaccharide-protein glycosyltransferase subunit OST5 [[Candida] railenensis]|uniref:Dolichyl-diphosphooligosaccharide-protein glycosyltransferase subunit OST5 n=1 Tax=[Candida] railenensis TaxID=45579 RepID=A0A9P0W0Z5_9ASCO|nr:putative dolichyl-diphosphooligosaccharide-protein glycosyltransferase subunit OST5 [[Candida] railenensis]
MALGEPYEEYSRVFYYGSSDVNRDARANPLVAVFFLLLSMCFSFPLLDQCTPGYTYHILTILAFASLSLAFLGDKRTQSAFSYTFYALGASLSIGLGSIYLSNTLGVYV